MKTVSAKIQSIYTDGACSGNPGPGGWGVVVYYEPQGVQELGGRDPQTTNNRMEMQAAIAALQFLKDSGQQEPITLYTDSEYVQKGITQWISGWKRKGWKTSTGKPVLNQDLWEQLDRLNSPQVQWRYVRGHAGNVGNERCDEIARAFTAGKQPDLKQFAPPPPAPVLPPFTKAHFDFAQLPYLTSPRQQLQLQGVALGLIRLPAGEGYTFTHSHAEQEEVYIVVEGQGSMVVDGELLSLEAGDVVRVSPPAKRALKAAADQALFVICAGAVPAGYPKEANARYLIDDGIPDYEDVPPWYVGNPEVIERNTQLKQRMLRSQAKRNGRQEG